MKVDFKAKQDEFSAYIRDPFNNPQPEDVKKQRMDTYRELFFNNVEGFLSSNFPVLKTILDEQQWFELSQDFFSRHQSTTPYFSEIPEEFIEYLQNERENSDDYPFLLELAHYEWVEMALSISQQEIIVNEPELLDELVLEDKISISSLAWPLVYQFPVQQISASFLPSLPPDQPTYLLVYRDKADEVKFIQISAITFRLLQMLQEKEAQVSCQSCLEQIIHESGYSDVEQIMVSGMEIIREFAEKNVIIVKTGS